MSKFNFKKTEENLKAVRRDLPVTLANEARNYFLDTFKNQGWDGDKWKEVQRRIEGTKAYKYPSKPKASSRTNPILIRTGRLKRTVRNSIKEASYQRVRLVVDLPYAQAINEGNDKMPQRKYMGDSPLLQKQQRQTIYNFFNKIWK